jgi:hypothetical protein
MKIRKSIALVVGTVAMVVGTVHAQVPWVPPGGSGSFFTYANGLSQNGLFGNPTLVGGDTFTFTPTNYIANSVNGVGASVPDLMQVELTANAGQRFTMIRITEFGSYGIVGGGTVQASGSLNLIDLLNVRAPAISPLVAGATAPVVQPMPISTVGSGLWSGSVVIDLTTIIGPDWTKLRLSFTNVLQATSIAGGSSFIDKKIVGGPSIIVEIFPAPGTASMLALGGMLVARRRRTV